MTDISAFAVSLARDIADALFGFLGDLYSGNEGGLPIIGAAQKNHRYLYLALLGLLVTLLLGVLHPQNPRKTAYIGAI